MQAFCVQKGPCLEQEYTPEGNIWIVETFCGRFERQRHTVSFHGSWPDGQVCQECAEIVYQD